MDGPRGSVDHTHIPWHPSCFHHRPALRLCSRQSSHHQHSPVSQQDSIIDFQHTMLARQCSCLSPLRRSLRKRAAAVVTVVSAPGRLTQLLRRVWMSRRTDRDFRVLFDGPRYCSVVSRTFISPILSFHPEIDRLKPFASSLPAHPGSPLAPRPAFPQAPKCPGPLIFLPTCWS